MRITTARWLVQIAFLLLFLFLFIQTESKGDDTLGYPVRLFLDFDPLVLLSTLLSSRGLVPGFLLSLSAVVATVFLGRVFCGWICPLGTIHNIAGIAAGRRKPVLPPGARKWKYWILFFLLSSSLFTMQVTGILDPLCLLVRSLALSVHPAFQNGFAALFRTAGDWPVPVLSALAEGLHDLFRKLLFSFREPRFFQAVFTGLLFGIIVGLNFVEKRFWCRYLCPLGALLGLLSRKALLKRSVSEGCTDCGVCGRVCQGRATGGDAREWASSECLACFECDDLCPSGSVRFGFRPGKGGRSFLPGRRSVLASLLAGAAAVPFFRVFPGSRAGVPSGKLIRPPGSLDEADFLARCVRCGECMKVCITNGLQPAFLEGGLEALWTPVLVPSVGYCEYRCTLCGRVCPTGAIKPLSPGEKESVRIGTAFIDFGRCLPHAFGIPCLVCQEVCPTAMKAVWFEKGIVTDREGGVRTVKKPYVDPARCVGCGTCEHNCPVRGEPAIRVVSTGESRSKENRLLL